MRHAYFDKNQVVEKMKEVIVRFNDCSNRIFILNTCYN